MCKILEPGGVFISRGSRKSTWSGRPDTASTRDSWRRSGSVYRQHACWPGVRHLSSDSSGRLSGAALDPHRFRCVATDGKSSGRRSSRPTARRARIRDAYRIEKARTVTIFESGDHVCRPSRGRAPHPRSTNQPAMPIGCRRAFGNGGIQYGNRLDALGAAAGGSSGACA